MLSSLLKTFADPALEGEPRRGGVSVVVPLSPSTQSLAGQVPPRCRKGPASPPSPLLPGEGGVSPTLLLHLFSRAGLLSEKTELEEASEQPYSSCSLSAEPALGPRSPDSMCPTVPAPAPSPQSPKQSALRFQLWCFVGGSHGV